MGRHSVESTAIASCLGLAVAAVLVGAGCLSARGAAPAGATARGVQTIGYTALNEQPGSKMAVREVAGRWYLYVGHLWNRGWSIVDVTDPAVPVVVTFVHGPANTSTSHTELAGNRMITPLEQLATQWGGTPGEPFEEGFLIWDVSDPVNPKRLGHYRTGSTGTHRVFYAGGRYVHCAAAVPGFDGRIYEIVDISDPVRPVAVGHWWVPGQHVAAGERPDRAGISMNGAPYVVGNLAYLPYGAAGLVVVDVGDVTRPRKVSDLRLTPPLADDTGASAVLPMPDRHLAFMTSGSSAEYCREPATYASVVDVSDSARPVVMSFLPRPAPPPGLPYSDFCEKGGRFGPNAVNLHQHSPDVEPQQDLLYVTYLNAGLRIFDIGNPRVPREVGSFMPPDPAERHGPVPTKLVSQTEDVLVDRRGFIYLTEENQGLWVLRYIGGGSS